jgi:predicted transglutaminase-like cysteine proteinase
LSIPPRPPLPRHLLARAARLALGLAIALAVPSLLAFDAGRLQRMAERMGPRAAASARLLPPLLHEGAALDAPGRLARINEFFNRHVVLREDTEVWGHTDHWASPLETLAKGAGDCEDFAIAKYFTLLAAGTPAERLRLVYVTAQIGGPSGPSQPHMVLAYYDKPDADPLILDNLITDVRRASARRDLRPVFSFNASGLWVGAGGEAAADPVAGLSRWREVQAKARAEGFL